MLTILLTENWICFKINDFQDHGKETMIKHQHTNNTKAHDWA